MKILLDNCLPRQFWRLLPGHDAVHCSRLAWGKLSNGKLLTAADAAGYSVLVTVDQGIQYQQNLGTLKIAVLYLRAHKNDLPTLKPMAGMVLATLDTIQAGCVIILDHPDFVDGNEK